MFSRISNAWSLAKSSWAVLQKDRELAWLPVMGGIGALVVGAVFFGPVIAMLGGGEDNAVPVAGYLLGFLGYVAVAMVFFLARAAVIQGANFRMEGGDPTVRTALRGATEHWAAVAGFATISVTVGLVLQAIRQNGGVVGAIVSFLGDVAWGVLTYLVLPVIVIEGVGTVAGIKGSTALVKRTWGEQVTANVGFGLLNLALVLPAIALVFLGAPVGGPLAVIVIAIAVAWAVTVSAIVATLTGIFQTALYRQATGRPIPPEFDAATLSRSFG
ncbi:MAG: DUF6159 family protein [Acidimicrobiales bacterium]